MKKIGILYGREESFPDALVQHINARGAADIVAESVKVGGVVMAEFCGYRVLIDRISQDIPFYRSYLKNAALRGTAVINNPFWWSADDKFFNYALASLIGIAIPRTVLLPNREHTPDTSERSYRNLMFPLNWDEIFAYVGFPAFLKPHSGGGWKHVYRVDSREEFFAAYEKTGDLCMTLQQGIEFEDYFRCYVIGQQQVHVMRYDPRRPHAERYVLEAPPIAADMHARVVRDCLTICRALGYDMNTVEFAVQGGVPYAIDFLNPAPDADLASVGRANFDWIVSAMADLAINEAKREPRAIGEYRWSNFLDSSSLSPPLA